MSTPYDDLVQRFTYKPGVRLSCNERANGTLELLLSTEAFNSRHPEALPRTFSRTHTIERGLTDEEVRDALVNLVGWWERHEMMEWMRWDGELIIDPHANGRLLP